MQFNQKLEQLEKRFEALTAQMADPAVIADSDQYRKVTKAQSELSEVVAKYRQWKKAADSLSQARGMLEEKDPDLREMAQDEILHLEPEMKQIEEIVKKAMGYSSERQDQVEVVNVQFGFEGEIGTGSATAVEDTPSVLKTYAPYIRYGVGAGLFLLILLFVVRPLVTALTTPSPGSSMQERAGGSSATVLSQSETPSLQQSQVLDLARNNPESTAVVVKQWLKAGT